jgi:hypothetical protein
MAALMGDLEVINGYHLGIARERHTGAHALDFDDGTCTLNDFFCDTGDVSTLPRNRGASLPRWVRSRTGCGIYFRERPWLRRFERGLGASSLSCGPPQAPATSAAPSRSAAGSEPRASLAGRDIRPRETEYKAIPKAGTEAPHATERAAPTIFCSRRTVRAPNICRPNRAVRRRRRSPSSQ